MSTIKALAPLLPRPSISPSPRQQPPSPPEMVEEERDVESQGHPLCCTQKHQTEEAVDGIFWDHQLGVRVRGQWLGARTDPGLKGTEGS